MEGPIKRHKICCTVSVSWLNLHQWIPQRDIRKMIYKLLDWNDRRIVEYAHTNKLSLLNNIHQLDCAQHGYLSMLQWMYCDLHFPINEAVYIFAAQYGHLNVIKWARSIKCPWDQWTTLFAARYGHLELLDWLYENGCPLGPSICDSAAIGGHLHIMKWLHSKDCKWSENTTVNAADCGYLELFQYLIDNGCLWNRGRCLRSRFPKIVEWIRNLAD